MANSTQPVVVTAAAAVAGSSVAPTTAIPDNCHTIILLNVSTTVAALFGQAAVGAALVEGTTGTRLPASSAVSLAVGTIKQRGSMDPAVAPNLGLVYTGIGGAAGIDITYLCGFGGL
jgi:hypothetical protein